MLPVLPGGGDVSVNVAVPLLPVTTSDCDSEPWDAPSVTRWPETGCPASLRTLIVITDCELPSRGRRSGTAFIVTDWPKPDGPISDGASWLSMPHATLVSAAAMRHAAIRTKLVLVVFIRPLGTRSPIRTGLDVL